MTDDFLIAALAGFVAAMVDGALGMGFGPTSSSVLLSTGLAPSAVSTVVNLAKVASGIAAGVSHWRFRNIDRRLVLHLAIPGCIGAGIGTTVLANVDGASVRPILAAMLLVVGLRIMARFSRSLPAHVPPMPVRAGTDVDGPAASDVGRVPVFDVRGVTMVAATGGVTNGLVGAWGPVVTPFLLHRGLPPRFAIGSVNTAEVAVAAVSAGSLLASFGVEGVDLHVVAGMLSGGVLAAPLAAWMVRFVPARGLGLAVGALLLLTSIRELATWADLGTARWAFYATVPLLVGICVVRPHFTCRTTARKERFEL